MTRAEFDRRFAATGDNWFEPETLDRLNDLAFAYLAEFDAETVDADTVKSAFDRANNSL